MKAWLILLAAIGSEIVGTTALRFSEGFTRLIPSLLVVLGYGMAFYLLSLTLKTIPLGTTYAVWSGAGTAIVALIGVWLWKEPVNLARVLGIGLIIVGVVLLNLGGKVAH